MPPSPTACPRCPPTISGRHAARGPRIWPGPGDRPVPGRTTRPRSASTAAGGSGLARSPTIWTARPPAESSAGDASWGTPPSSLASRRTLSGDGPPPVSPAAFAWEMPDPPPSSPSSPARELPAGGHGHEKRDPSAAAPRRPGPADTRGQRDRRPRAMRLQPGRRPGPERSSKRVGAAGPPDRGPGRALVGDEVQLRGLPGRFCHLVRGRERALRRAVRARRVRVAAKGGDRASPPARARSA